MTYNIDFLRKNEVTKLGESAAEVLVGSSSPIDRTLRRTLQAYHGKRISVQLVERHELRSLIQAELSEDPDEGLLDAGRPGDFAVSGLVADELVRGAPAVNRVNSLLTDAVRSRASDIHISSGGASARVLYRVDGRLIPKTRVSAQHFAMVSARLKVLARLNAAERRRPQDGRFTAELDGESFDIRFSSLPTIGGESLVLRLFPSSGSTFNLESLGLLPSTLSRLRTAIDRASGLILVAGPTGSGKTTTLHACIRELQHSRRKIVTIEDPVEYHLPGIDQIQTNEAVDLTFDTILKRVLRQDPDVIMIGEIRDPETAGLAMRAAVTGHLVLSTVHARSGEAVVRRLQGLGVDVETLQTITPLVMEQRLVRIPCAACSGRGCQSCHGCGSTGRTGLFGASLGRHPAETLAEAGLTKVTEGTTTHLEFAWACAG